VNGYLRFKGPIGLVNGLAYSPDGLQLLSGCEQNGVVLWDALKGTQLRTLDVNFNSAVARPVAFSPSGHLGVAGDNGDGMHLFDLKSGRELQQWRANFNAFIEVASFSPDGERILYGSTGRFKLWTRARGEIGAFNGNCASFSPDDKLMATAGAGTLQVLEAAGLKPVREWQLPGPVHAVAFAHDGRHIATANGNGTVYIFRLADGPPRALSAAGGKAAAGGRSETLRRARRGRELHRHEVAVCSAGALPDGVARKRAGAGGKRRTTAFSYNHKTILHG